MIFDGKIFHFDFNSIQFDFQGIGCEVGKDSAESVLPGF